MSMGSDKVQTTTQNSSTSYAPWTQNANLAVTMAGLGMNQGFIKAPAYQVAGFNPDQLKAFDLSRTMAQDAFTGGQTAVPTNTTMKAATVTPYKPIAAALTGAQPKAVASQATAAQAGPAAMFGGVQAGPASQVMAAMAGPAAQFQAAQAGPASQVTAAQAGPAAYFGGAQAGPAAQSEAARAVASRLGGNDFKEFLNPYIQSVIDPTIARARQELGATQAQIGAKAAAAGAFGGSREALQRGRANRDFAQDTALMEAQLRMQGYDSATASAMANAQMQQEVGLANAGYQQQTNLQNAANRQQTELENAGFRQQTGITNADRAQAVNLANAGFQQEAGLTNAQLSQAINLANAGFQQEAGLTNTQLQQAINLANSGYRQEAGLTNAQLAQQVNLENAGFNQQAGLANADRSQQVNLANTGYKQDAALQNASYQQQTALANAEAQRQIALANTANQQQTWLQNAQNGLSVNLANAGYQQQANTSNLDALLKSATLQDQFKNTAQDRQQKALATLLGLGNQQQLFAQNALDVPWTALQRAASVIPAVYNSSGTQTGTQPDNSPGFLQTLLGLGTTLAGMPVAGAVGADGGSVGGNFLAGLLK